MSSYAPASSLGWLDLDAAASERVGTLLRSLEEPGTLDVLGLGSVRDAFSSLLSPGTSTIQTRVRYFVFLPWIFNRLQTERVPPAKFALRLRDAEAQLIDCLRHLGPDHGVIGYSAGRELKRLPSEVYWGGLGSWGLRRLDLTLAEYGKRAAALGRRQLDRDDDGNLAQPVATMWATMPEPPRDFLDAELTFDLTFDEAHLLADHIRERHAGTLLAVMCGQPQPVEKVAFPWELPTKGMPTQLVDALRHARCFSELTTGPQHVYNVLLARKARHEFHWDTDELESRELEHLGGWVNLVEDRYAELKDWADHLPKFWEFLAPVEAISPSTRQFVETIVAKAMSNLDGFVEDPEVQNCIRNREIRLKSKRARLGHRAALENWNQAPFGGQLNYRWPITRSYLVDIAAGMERTV